MLRLFTTVAFLILLTAPVHAFLLERSITSTTPVTIDWANWDASYNSSSGQVFSDLGFGGPPTIECYNSTDCIMPIRYRSAPEQRYVSLIRRSGMSITEVDRLATTVGDVGVQSAQAVLTNERFLVGWSGDADPLETLLYNIVLVGRSGDTLSNLAQNDMSSVLTDTESGYFTIDRLTDTKAIIWYTDDETTRSVVIADISGDEITYSSAVKATNVNSGQLTGSVVPINSTDFLVSTVNDLNLYRLDGGGNPVELNNIATTRTYTGVIGMIPLRTNRYAYVGIRSTNPPQLWCEVYTITGAGSDTITRVASQQITTSYDLWANGPEDKKMVVVDSDNGIGFMVSQDDNLGFYDTRLLKFTLATDNTCSVEAITSSVSADHTTIGVFPNGSTPRHIIQVGQDGLSSPIIDAVSYAIFDGATP